MVIFLVGFAENKAMEDVNERVTKAEPTVVWFADGLRKRRQCANALQSVSSHTCTWGHVPCKIERLKGEARTATES